MKPNEAPEKIYLLPRQGGDYAPYWKADSSDGFGIEYTRTDAFIEKACEYIKEHLFDYWSQSVTNESKFIKDFINYMKGE